MNIMVTDVTCCYNRLATYVASLLLCRLFAIVNEFTLLAECGLAPTVTLNCDNGFAYVDWTPSQPWCHHDCKGYWACWNAANTSNYHRQRVTS